MRELEKIATELFDKLRSRFETVSLGDENAKHTSDPEKARFFNFNYTDDEDDYGNVTISILDGESLKVYFGRQLSKKMDEDSKDIWYDFLRQLRFFSKRNLLTFDTRDIARDSLGLKDVKQASKADGTYSSMEITNESRLYGTPKHSFENIGNARIRILHTESINPEQRGSRSRHIHAIYIENKQGERFMLEHNKLSAARAMARHISEGGNPYDDVAKHINGMVAEMQELGRFVRGMRRRTFEDSTTTTMVEAATAYYSNLSRQLNHLQGPKAYHSFIENFQPSDEQQQLAEDDVNELKEKFVKKIFDDRMTAALPLVHKAYKLHEESKQRQFESVKSVIRHQAPLTLVTNEGMDEYFQALSFSDPKELVVRVLENIATRAQPEIAEFAKHWATNFNNVTEDADDVVKEHRAAAVQLATCYLKDLKELKHNSDLRIAESEVEEEPAEDDIMEGTWAIPETPEELMALKELLAQELPVGVDGENATSALYNLIGDDQLFDAIGEKADNEGPDADAVPIIKHYLQDNMPGLYDKLGFTTDDMSATEPAPAEPAPAEPAPAAPMAMAPAPEEQPVPAAESINQILRLAGMNNILVK